MLFSKQTFLVAGLSRSGIAASEYLISRGATVYLYDDVDDEGVRAAVSRLTEQGCTAVAKDELPDRMKKCDVLVISPGIPIDHPLPVAFKKAGGRIIGEAELGALDLRCPSVAVTGTNGKTTTVTMIDNILRTAGMKSVACGNVGKPICAALSELDENSVAAIEISSFQLETLYSLRPHVAVVLNISEDHLNRHYNMENYIFLKSRLLKNSAESEYVVLNRDDPVVRGFAEKTRAKIVWFSLKEKVDGAYLENGRFYYNGEPILSEDELPVGGEHNRANALAAIAACKLMGAGNAAIAAALKSFRGVKHRLERIGDVKGVSFIDDSKATNVDSAIKAVGSVKGESIILLGGKDKGYTYEPLFDAIKESNVVHAVLYGENAFRILQSALKKGYTSVTLCRPFDLAVRVAYLTAKQGQNVLLSPASASFDAFTSYEERGKRFAEMMKLLKSEEERDLPVSVVEEQGEEIE